MHLAIQQRVLPDYRVGFFRKLADEWNGKLSIISGDPEVQEGIKKGNLSDQNFYYRVKNQHVRLFSQSIFWQCNLLSWIREIHPDVIVFEANPRLISNYVAILYCRWKKIKVIGWGLGVMKHRSYSPLIYQPFSRQYFRQFDAMIAYSLKAKTDYEDYGVSPSQVFFAPNAVSGEASRESGPGKKWRSIDQWRLRHNLNESSVILYVGRLTQPKKVDVLIEVIAEMEVRPSLLLAGDGPERSNLEEQSEKLGVNVSFAGHITGSALIECFRYSDILVMPGSGGLAVQQAMYHGLPVIATDGDGSVKELIDDGVNSYLVSGEKSDLKKALSVAITNKRNLVSMGAAARIKITGSCTVEIMVSKFLDAVNRVGRAR